MLGQDVHSNFRALKEAKQKIKNCQIIFTTCIGAGLGLLRKERFEIVIVDEASQQTEPASLVPLVKGCVKAIMVGDHSQLRPTVQQHTLALDFDVSLFERLYTSPPTSEVRRLMLETQYRMHPSICEFSSREFYESRLKTGVEPRSRPLFASHFPWPTKQSPNDTDYERMILIECAGKELLGQKSKGNEFQARLCAHVCKLLTTPLATPSQSAAPTGPKQNLTSEPQGIVILTPYTRQADMLKSLVSGFPGVEVSSIDGFQGREADIVIFCTVRCNDHGNIGFLKDLRRMNVALTRARAGLIVVGNRATLTGGKADPESTEMWKRLLDGVVSVGIELPA
jgi:superfamily I DNA and/or RNA helicase